VHAASGISVTRYSPTASPPTCPRAPLNAPRRLYFKTLSWLRLLFIWLTLGAVPFLVVITNSKFTSAALGGRTQTELENGKSPEVVWQAPESGVRTYRSVSSSEQCRLYLGRSHHQQQQAGICTALSPRLAG
jgi:hypothetical protein